jgi:hypothetical protein
VGERHEAFGSVIGPALGFNVVTDTSCRLAGPGDLVGVASSLGPLRENGGSHETQMPGADSPVLGLMPATACLVAPLPVLHEGEHHLAAQVPDLRALMRTDQRGVPRALDGRCDAGAVEVPG